MIFLRAAFVIGFINCVCPCPLNSAPSFCTISHFGNDSTIGFVSVVSHSRSCFNMSFFSFMRCCSSIPSNDRFIGVRCGLLLISLSSSLSVCCFVLS